MLNWITKIRHTDSSVSIKYAKWCNDFTEKSNRLSEMMREKKDQGSVKLDGEIYRSIVDLDDHLKEFDTGVSYILSFLQTSSNVFHSFLPLSNIKRHL